MAVQQFKDESLPLTPVATKSYVVSRGLIGHLRSTILVPMGHAASRAIQIYVACTSIQCHGVMWARAAAEGPVWVCVLLAVWVCVDVRGYCCHRAHADCWV